MGEEADKSRLIIDLLMSSLCIGTNYSAEPSSFLPTLMLDTLNDALDFLEESENNDGGKIYIVKNEEKCREIAEKNDGHSYKSGSQVVIWIQWKNKEGIKTLFIFFTKF